MLEREMSENSTVQVWTEYEHTWLRGHTVSTISRGKRLHTDMYLQALRQLSDRLLQEERH